MPSFSDILDRALSIALQSQSFEIAHVIHAQQISSPPMAIQKAWDNLTQAQQRTLEEITTRAYFELRGAEIKAEHMTRPKP